MHILSEHFLMTNFYPKKFLIHSSKFQKLISSLQETAFHHCTFCASLHVKTNPAFVCKHYCVCIYDALAITHIRVHTPTNLPTLLRQHIHTHDLCVRVCQYV